MRMVLLPLLLPAIYASLALVFAISIDDFVISAFLSAGQRRLRRRQRHPPLLRDAWRRVPLILLHGGLGSGEMFGPILPALTEQHRVIAVDLQGHGRTADIDRPLDVRIMADDVAALIEHLGLDRPDVVGYSLSGGVALFTAVKHPEKVGKLVIASTNMWPDAIHAEMREQQGQVSAAAVEFMKDTPMYELYQRVAPAPRTFHACSTRSARR